MNRILFIKTSKTMNRFFLKIFIFFAVITAFDVAIGIVLPIMQSKNKDYNQDTKLLYLAEQCKDDILIFGSSRAYRHYNPQIIIDSLNFSCFNCGQSGMGIIHNYAVLKIATNNYHPKLIIYDLFSLFDYEFEDPEDYHINLRGLGPFIYNSGVTNVFNAIDVLEKYKVISNLYAYNDIFNSVIADFIGPGEKGLSNHGFAGSSSENNFIRKNVKNEISPVKIDSLKIRYLKRFVDECKGDKVVFCVSPFWNGLDEQRVQYSRRLCQELNVTLIDFSNDPKYVHHDKYFLDEVHLNALGADEYTKDLIKKLKEIM